MKPCLECQGPKREFAGYRLNVCTQCNGSGKVPTSSELVEAVRAAAGNHLLNANQCLTWLQDMARK